MKVITKTGIWLCDEDYDWERLLALRLAKYLHGQKAKEIADIGCGQGKYVDYFNKKGFYCDGYDGNLMLENEEIKTIDFTKKDTKLEKVYDWLISLEVAEHIPKKFEDNYISLLHEHNKKGIIISWSDDKDNGDGHVNTRDAYYVDSLFLLHGYLRDHKNEKRIREGNYRLPYWHNLFIFKKR